ncbi:MAG: hypothetical protein Q8S84_06075 [bacterium]|nr:hypothetical protein [bacterium]
MDEQYQVMQQQQHQLHIHKHGMGRYGNQQQIGEKTKQHVILIVMQITHGIQMHVFETHKQ